MEKSKMSKVEYEVQEWVREMMHLGAVMVTFTKKDGTERQMASTLNPDLIPDECLPVGSDYKKNEDVQAVYDIDAQGWRSFRWDSVKNISFSLDFTD